jgi:hypothetical protein
MINWRSSGKCADVTGPGDSQFLIVQVHWVFTVDFVEDFAVFGIGIRELFSKPWVLKPLAVFGSADTVRLKVSVAVNSLTLCRREKLGNILARNECNYIVCVALWVDFACMHGHIGICFEADCGLYLRTMSILCRLHNMEAGWIGLQRSLHLRGLSFTLYGGFGIEGLGISI